MLFNSYAFVVFFISVYGLYWVLCRHWKFQNVLLLAASMFFYGWWDVRFLYLFILTTAVDFYCALMIHQGRVSGRQRGITSLVLLGSALLCVTVQWKAVGVIRAGLHLSFAVDWSALLPHDVAGWAVLLGTLTVVVGMNLANPWLTSFSENRRRKIFLVASIASNLGVLGFFKYYNFFASSFAEVIHSVFGITPSAWTLHIILPVGISFYTFQSLAYTIDVYRRKFEPIPHYLTLATGLSFFPLLVAGPIERPNHLLPQFLRPRNVNGEQWREGIWLIFWGLFKKLVVADNMAVIVTSVFGPYDGANPSHVVPPDGLRMLLGVYAFALQIYGDFSGYSDIARGTGRLLGFDVMRNFNLPYFAVSPSDFWQRWHISLSSWLRDYLYIPLGGNKSGKHKTYRNLFLTMLLGGLWHGAAWTYVFWGAYQGTILILYRLFERKSKTTPPSRDCSTNPAARPDPVTVTTYVTVAPVPFNRRWQQITPPVRKFLAILLMFHLTCLGWLLFRAQNMTAVGVFLQSIILHPFGSSGATAIARDILFYSCFLLLFQALQISMKTLDPMKRLPWFVRLNVWIFIIMSILAFSPRTAASFIYFAF